MKKLKFQKCALLFTLLLFAFSLDVASQNPKPLSPEQQQLLVVKNQIMESLQNFDQDSKKLTLTDDTLLQIELGNILWDVDKSDALERYKMSFEQLAKAINDFLRNGKNSKYRFEELFAASEKVLKTVSGKVKN